MGALRSARCTRSMRHSQEKVAGGGAAGWRKFRLHLALAKTKISDVETRT